MPKQLIHLGEPVRGLVGKYLKAHYSTPTAEEEGTEMQRPILVLLFSVFFTSLCAFGSETATDTVWQIAGVGGSYSYAGGASDLIASGIAIDSVVDANESSSFGSTFTVIGTNTGGTANLSFTTGAGTAGQYSWTSGGTLTLTGCIENGSSGACIAAETLSTVLVSDEFTSVGIVPIGGGNGFEFGGLEGTLDPVAAAFLNVNQTFTSPASQMDDEVAGVPSIAGSSFSTGVSTTPGGNLDLYAAIAPEPGSTILFGTGLLCIAFVIRKRLFA